MKNREFRNELPWGSPPLSLLNPHQQSNLNASVKLVVFELGKTIWDTQDLSGVFYIVAGKVRLKNLETGRTERLKAGDWLGDTLDLSGHFQAVASETVQVVRWNAESWQAIDNQEVSSFWRDVRGRYQPDAEETAKRLKGFEFVFSSEPPAAACLLMIARSLKIPAGDLRSIQRLVTDQTPESVMRAGERLGFTLQPVRIDTWQDLNQNQFPSLVHLNDRSWFVVYGVRGNQIIIADPADADGTSEGVSLVPRSQLLDDTGWDRTLWRVDAVQEQEKFNLTWFLPVLKKYRWLLAEVLVLSIFVQLLGVVTPLLTQVIVDKAMVNESRSTLNVMIIALFAVTSFEGIFNILRLYLFTHTANRIDLRLSAQIFRHLLRLPLGYFEARRVGDTVARVQQLEHIRQFLTGTALTVILDGIFVILYLGIMCFYNWKLTLVALATIPLFGLLILFMTPRLRHWLDQMFDRGADSQSFLTEAISGIHGVKAHGADWMVRQRWESLYARYIRMSFKASTTSNISGSIADFLTHTSHLLVLWIGAGFVIDHHLQIGQLIAFQMLSDKVTEPLLRLIQLQQDIQQVLQSVDRLGDILNEKPLLSGNTSQDIELPKLQGRVKFERVCFRYPSSSPDHEAKQVLRGVSFEIEPGQLIGVVGRSGSGKSTLSKLLQRLYEPESGRIMLDEFELKTISAASVQRNIAVVLQEDVLFKGTIAENIKLWRDDILPEKVQEAARNADAHSFIMDLPEGYNTELGERGIGLSGGQRQRITLARLFLSDAPILILDEATSALDSETERTVLKNLRKIKEDCTIFMITHRFSSIQQADHILVLQDGVLMEQGTHKELMEGKEVYWTLYQRQLEEI